jgi:four helix bundle protein
MQDFRRLDVWGKAHELVVILYRSTTTVSERRYPGLTSQLRRAASAVPANIAEGCGHGSQREFARFLQIALASAHELHYHLLLARDLDLLQNVAFARLEARTEQVKKMLSALLARVREPLASSPAGIAKRRRSLPPTAVSRQP